MGIVELNPSHEIMEGVDVVWQIPANPKAILFLVHSFNGTPFSYWPSHPNAPQCIGTPEHVLATKQALARGFAVIAGKSVGDEWVHWPISSAVDVQNFKKILKAWASKHGLQDLPLTAWGTSNGGGFVSSLATVSTAVAQGKRKGSRSAGRPIFWVCKHASLLEIIELLDRGKIICSAKIMENSGL